MTWQSTIAVAAARTVAVLLPLPLPEPYDYAVPEGLAVEPGQFVLVPLGSRQVLGVAWGSARGEVAIERLKPVAEVVDVAPLPEVERRFIDWVAAYTVTPPGAVLRMAMSVHGALEPPRPVLAYAAAESNPEQLPIKLTPARQRVMDLLIGGPPRLPRELLREAGVGSGVVKGLLEAGAILPIELPARSPFEMPDVSRPGVALSDAQHQAAEALRGKVACGGFSVTLLDGVAGAGKTEVYFEAIAAALAEGQQALVLVPEIALTAQWLERFERRFGVRPAEWHSDLTQTQRRLTWRAIADGNAPVLVGARSALFLPFPRLGLIVVDEEHDGSFKQEDGVTYHARDMAVVRARLGDHSIVLVSATPSLETIENVRVGRYGIISLPDRHGGALMPRIEAIDMRRDPPPRQAWLSPVLRAALTETLAASEQAVLFLNRRGYAPLTLCRTCGHRLECPRCSAWLVEHRLIGRLQCHHCGYAVPPPRTCPSCGAQHSFAACGPGVERVKEEVAKLFPEARCEIVTSDTLGGPVQVSELMRRIAAHEIDVLVGTQVIAKGHHFPLITLVGVVDADLGLNGGDLRAAERTYQLLTQVAGRAGREALPGRVFLQTYVPEHPVMQALVSGDRERFLAAEAAARRAAGMPPFGRLAAVIVSGADPREVDAAAASLARAAPHSKDVTVLGPAPAPLSLLRGRHRRRLLLKAGRQVNVQAALHSWLGAVAVPPRVRVQVDVDPYSFT